MKQNKASNNLSVYLSVGIYIYTVKELVGNKDQTATEQGTSLQLCHSALIEISRRSDSSISLADYLLYLVYST